MEFTTVTADERGFGTKRGREREGGGGREGGDRIAVDRNTREREEYIGRRVIGSRLITR